MSLDYLKPYSFLRHREVVKEIVIYVAKSHLFAQRASIAWVFVRGRKKSHFNFFIFPFKSGKHSHYVI